MTQEVIASATEYEPPAPGDENCSHADAAEIGQAWNSADNDGDGVPETHTLVYSAYRCTCGAEWRVDA